MTEITTSQDPRNPAWPYLLGFFSIVITIASKGPDQIQRIVLSFALILSYVDIMRGIWKIPKHWLVNGLFTYYQLLMSLTFVVIVTWENSAVFWDHAPKYTFGVIFFSILVSAYYAFKERGTAKNVAQSIRNPGFLFGAIALWQIMAQVLISFQPEVGIAQLCAFIIPLGFIAQPFAPSKPLPFAPFLTLKRISFIIVVVVLLADWLMR